ncbi:MAG: Tol-Pal system protein TolQ [Chlamydiia bacterium]|nr:Tol-Pal system protein TolQ [Chlamydiia bacterium]
MVIFQKTLAANIFVTAYHQSDLFGKGIFLALGFLSLITWVIILQKTLSLRSVRKLSDQFIEAMQKQKSRILSVNPVSDDAPSTVHPFKEIYTCLKSKTLEILEKNHFFSKKSEGDEASTFLSSSDIDLMQAQLQVTITSQMKQIETNLFVLPVVVSLAPFLGILGTVWGILISLSEMQKGALQSQAVVLSGLSTALGTTVLGLVIAIPALIAHSYLKNAIRSFAVDMDDFSNLLLSTIEMQYRRVDTQ